MTEAQLTEQIHRLAEGLEAPPGDADGDLVRGRARLRRRRTTLAGGVLTVALAGGLAWSALDTDSAPPVAGEPATIQPGAPADLRDDLEARVRELAAPTRSREDELPAITVRQLRWITDALVDRVSGPLGWLSVGTSDSWQASGAEACPRGWTCEDAQVRGADRARWAEAGTVHQLAVEVDGHVHLFTLNGADERPAEVAWGGTRP